ncbi:MAG: type II secretion system protein [Candidatus Dojkabacteria bacterium]
MKFSNFQKKYSAYTLMEMLVVLSILIILGAMTFSAFDGLQNTIKLNEYMLTLEQDIRNVQRSSMLLQRNSGERWLYGLGIDFSNVTEDGEYKTFKWCSPYDDYGNITTKSKLPAYDPELNIDDSNAHLPFVDIDSYTNSSCSMLDPVSEIKNLPGYDRSSRPPKAQITVLGTDDESVDYVLFESVSGRTFFYNADGDLLNYNSDGERIQNPVNFDLEITPLGKGSKRKLTINNLSGKITTYMYQ